MAVSIGVRPGWSLTYPTLTDPGRPMPLYAVSKDGNLRPPDRPSTWTLDRKVPPGSYSLLSPDSVRPPRPTEPEGHPTVSQPQTQNRERPPGEVWYRVRVGSQ